MALDRRWHRVSEPHRTLRTGMRGEDVKRFQIGLKERASHVKGLEDTGKKLKVDGVFGKESLSLFRNVEFAIGLPANHAATRRAQLNVRRPWARSRTAVKRAKARRAYRPHGRETAVRWAQSKRGVHEQPAGSNAGPEISQWIRNGGGVPGWSWCQYFACEVAVQGGASRIRDGYTVNFLAGHYRSQGYVPIPYSEALPGDFVYYKWPGVSGDICDHVGVKRALYVDIEGNTSSSNGGSQNNGGGVYERGSERRPYIVGAVRVPYNN